MAVAVIIVIIVGLGVIATALMVRNSSDDGSDDGSDETPLTGIVLVVNDAHESYSGWFLEDDHKYVVYNITFTNHYKSSDVYFWEYSFELHTTDGLVYNPSYTAGTTMSNPESIDPGGSYTFDLAYEIGSSDSGKRIDYEYWFEEASVDVPL